MPCFAFLLPPACLPASPFPVERLSLCCLQPLFPLCFASLFSCERVCCLHVDDDDDDQTSAAASLSCCSTAIAAHDCVSLSLLAFGGQSGRERSALSLSLLSCSRFPALMHGSHVLPVSLSLSLADAARPLFRKPLNQQQQQRLLSHQSRSLVHSSSDDNERQAGRQTGWGREKPSFRQKQRQR